MQFIAFILRFFLLKTTAKTNTKQTHSLTYSKNSDHAEYADHEKDVLRHMCEQCGYRTRILGNLKVHKRRHTGEKPFRCDICNASFVARYQLTTHFERHMDTDQRRNRYMCRECNVGFLSARALYHHKPLHAQVKQYKCGICEKSYAQAAGYAQHKRWHRQRNERGTATTNFKIPDTIKTNLN